MTIGTYYFVHSLLCFYQVEKIAAHLQNKKARMVFRKDGT